MNQTYIVTNPWKIIEQGFNPEHITASESIFSLGNGAMGQRANFEEHYSGDSFQGSYIGGVYYPDKTRVGWWKNGYPDYFAKVLNAPNWIGIDVQIDGETLDLFSCKSVHSFYRELDMQTGVYTRTAEIELHNGAIIRLVSKRFLSMDENELGAIEYQITPINKEARVDVQPYLDGKIKNNDSNWEDPFWKTLDCSFENGTGFLMSKTHKSHFNVCTYMKAQFHIDGVVQKETATPLIKSDSCSVKFSIQLKQGKTLTTVKYGGYLVDTNHKKSHLKNQAKQLVDSACKKGFDLLKKEHSKQWQEIWKTSDIVIDGDDKAQQAIRFNIFQLNQTYTGDDARLNIGPKGFTGEKYGGSTYWDTEAYCVPFYMATKQHQVARNLLVYRYNQLDKAIENAQKLGLKNGAALYPMVTINGEECHNEWEITFEEIHRNAAIAFAIFNYERYTADLSYVPEMGLEVLIGIARFWKERVNFSEEKKQYVILGVTGPNEYENNVNNNWYTNYAAKWCLEFTHKKIREIEKNNPEDFLRISERTKITDKETKQWLEIAEALYLPVHPNKEVYLQQDGFLDKVLKDVNHIDPKERPINQNWSWDRILRSPYIKQADVLQGFYFFNEHFSLEELEKHFDFYEPLTVHESSLSPCIHSILAAKLNRMEQAYSFYLRTSRLDLDDYNSEVHEGLHITSMAGTWMSIVEGFGGMQVKNNILSFEPRIPKQWKAYSFTINFREHTLQVTISHQEKKFELKTEGQLKIQVNGVSTSLSSVNQLTLA